MTNDNIPAPDPEFHNWVVPFSAYVASNATAMGLDTTDVAPLTAAVGVWGTVYPAHKTASSSAVAARTIKDQARSDIEDVARPLIQQLQASPRVTDAQRNAMKINVRSTTRTPASVPTTAPMGTVDTSRRLQHVISYRDAASPAPRKNPPAWPVVKSGPRWVRPRRPIPASSPTWAMPPSRRRWRNTPAPRPD